MTQDTDKQRLRQRLQDWRVKEDLRSGKAAAERLKVSVGAYYNWESGHAWPDPTNLRKLEQAGVDLSFLDQSEPSLREIKESIDRLFSIIKGQMRENGTPEAIADEAAARVRAEILAELGADPPPAENDPPPVRRIHGR